MTYLRRWISLLTIATMITTGGSSASAREFCTDAGGCAYEDAYQSCCLAPAIALALVAIAAIIAVGVHNRSHSSHDHNGDSDSD